MALYRPDFTLAPGLNPFLTTGLDTKYKEYAAFGDLTWRLTDAFDLSGGVRFARNEQSWAQTSGEGISAPQQPASSAGMMSERIELPAITACSGPVPWRAKTRR